MESNLTSFNSTLVQVIELINVTVNVTVNNSDVVKSVAPINDLHEEYVKNERNSILLYMTYTIAVLIILSNLSVVVSSGLILKNGQKPKSTYILLGNVSLADTIVGFSIIYGLTVEYNLKNNAMCIFQMGMLVCPAMVSVYSVGLIAIDRYLYILHGLYYERWFNTNRVRIGILIAWIISITLSFIPATGWVNHELTKTRCSFVGLFPGPLIIIHSVLGIILISVVIVLYTFIMIKALKTVKTIKNPVNIKEITPSKEPKIRINRRTSVTAINSNAQSVTSLEKNDHKMKRSASFQPEYKYRSKSIEDLSNDLSNCTNNKFRKDKQRKSKFKLDFSDCTVESLTPIQSISNSDDKNIQPNRLVMPVKKAAKARKIREPNKWRAIMVVMLTSGGVFITWIPFFVTLIFFVLCEDKVTNPKCIRVRALFIGLSILAFVNSILNPLIYAWWHKGFQRSIKTYYRQYVHNNRLYDKEAK